MKEVLRRTRASAVVAASTAALLLHGAPEAAETPYTNVPAAALAISDRYGGCVLRDVQSDVQPASDGYTNQRYTISYAMDLKLRESTKPFFDAFVERSEVKWQDSAVVVRTAPTPKAAYVPAPSMPQGALSNETATTVEGTLEPRRWYSPGAVIDIWKDETTTGAGTQYLNAEYCGRLVLTAVGDGKNTWHHDPGATAPLAELQTKTNHRAEQYQSYSNEMLLQH